MASAQETIPRLLSIEATCATLGGISRVTLWRMIRRGEIATVQVGRRPMVEPDELRRFIDENRGRPEAADR